MKAKSLGLTAVTLAALASQAHADTVYTWTVEKWADKSDVVLSIGQSEDVVFTVRYSFSTSEQNPLSADTIDECITATDDRWISEETICSASTTVSYTVTYGPYSEPLSDSDLNTASFRTNDTFAEGSASWNVRILVGETQVPVPGTVALLGLGLAALRLSRRSKAR